MPCPGLSSVSHFAFGLKLNCVPVYPSSYLSGTPSSTKFTNPENSGESNDAEAETLSKPFTTNIGFGDFLFQQTDSISVGKLSPPLLTAVIL